MFIERLLLMFCRFDYMVKLYRANDPSSKLYLSQAHETYQLSVRIKGLDHPDNTELTNLIETLERK